MLGNPKLKIVISSSSTMHNRTVYNHIGSLCEICFIGDLSASALVILCCKCAIIDSQKIGMISVCCLI